MSTSTLMVIAAVVMFIVMFVLPRLGTIPGAEARKLVSEGALLVDVRTPAEYASGHVEGAVNIPVQELGQRVGELGDKDRSIVLYCRSGARSGGAQRELKAQGFTNVHNMGPMSAW